MKQNRHEYFTLKEGDKKVDIKVEQLSNGDVGVRFKGYGEFAAKEGEGMPVLLTLEQGELQVAVWSDINQEDATHIISMEKAKESNYQKVVESEPVKQAVKFTEEEQVIIHEIARYALADAEVFDSTADYLDISDSFLKNLQEKLAKEGNNG